MLDYAAYKYSRRTKLYDREDVYQECCLAFINSVLKFDLVNFKWFNLGRWAKIFVKNHVSRLWRLDAHIRIPRCDPGRQAEVARNSRRVTQFSQMNSAAHDFSKTTKKESLIVDKRHLSPVEQLERAEQIEAIRKSIETLTGRQITVVGLVSAGFTYAEIGRDYGVTRQAIENCYKRSLKSLEDKLCELGFHKDAVHV